MNAHRSRTPASVPARQRGFATLLVAVVLLIAITLITFTNANTSLVETQMSNNQYRTSEAQQAAEAALEYGTAWLDAHTPTWTALAGTHEESEPDGTIPPMSAGNGDSYGLNVVYRRDTTNNDFVLVTATAQSISDQSLQATARQYVLVNSWINDPLVNAPPLVLDGCLDDAAGSPDIWAGSANNIAAATTRPDNGSWDDCLDKGDSGGAGVKTHGGNAVGEYFGPGYSGDIWDQLFTKSRADMKAIAAKEDAAGLAYTDPRRTVVWVTSDSPYHQNAGTPSSPVAVIMAPEAQCPKINGSPVIYGIVFVDSDCIANGWGGTTVYGSVVIKGDVSKLNSGTQLHHWEDANATNTLDQEWHDVAGIPGTWRNF